MSNPPKNADAYRFDSVAVKEPKFEIDGVFLPPENEGAGVVYFCEVQFQKDEQLYERLFAESSLYFYRNRARFSDWQAVIIYPTCSIEQIAIEFANSRMSEFCFQDLLYLQDKVGEFAHIFVLLPLPVSCVLHQEHLEDFAVWRKEESRFLWD